MVAKPSVAPPARRPPERPWRAPGSSRKLVWSQNLMRGFPRGAPPERPRRAPGSSRRHVWSQNLMWGLPRGAPWSAPGAPQEAPGGTCGRKTSCGASRAVPPGAPQGARPSSWGAPWSAPGGAAREAAQKVLRPCGFGSRAAFFLCSLFFFVCVHSAFFMCSLGVFVGVQSAFFSVFTRRFSMFHSAFCRCSLGDFHVFTRRFSGVHSAICRCSLLRFLVFTRRSGGRKLLAQHCGCRALRGREACDITSSPTRRDRYFVHIAACALRIEGVFGELSSLSLLGLAAKASATLSPDRTYFTSQCRLET